MMSYKNIYLVLAILGFLMPYSLFFPWLLAHGFDFPHFFTLLFANPIGGAFGLDVFVSAVVLIFFITVEGKRIGMTRRWIPILGTLFVGVSFGLPLFLYMRESILGDYHR
ncbi:MAG: DUF2834 domain-containing protein [Epsilonproteobacteria bacterium]|nr:DUF2834 domain-containing protein [Campylobacterota bacterium]